MMSQKPVFLALTLNSHWPSLGYLKIELDLAHSHQVTRLDTGNCGGMLTFALICSKQCSQRNKYTNKGRQFCTETQIQKVINKQTNQKPQTNKVEATQNKYFSVFPVSVLYGSLLNKKNWRLTSKRKFDVRFQFDTEKFDTKNLEISVRKIQY